MFDTVGILKPVLENNLEDIDSHVRGCQAIIRELAVHVDCDHKRQSCEDVKCLNHYLTEKRKVVVELQEVLRKHGYAREG